MIKDKDITRSNVDDHIREKRKSGASKIYWGENGAKHLRRFARMFYRNEFRFPHSFPNGHVFMGVKHYKIK